MPVDYNNLKSPYDSNVYRDVSPSQQNWTRLGVKALSLWTQREYGTCRQLYVVLLIRITR